MLSKKALYKVPNSPYWRYRFQLGGEKFQCSTGTANRKEAWEAARKAYREAETLKRETPVSNGLVGYTIATAATRWLEDVVSKWTNANNRAYAKNYAGDIVTFFEEEKGIKRLDQIDLQAARDLAKWRRSQTKWGLDSYRDRANPAEYVEADTVSNATVNRTALLPLKYILAQARHWGVPGLQSIVWKEVLLKETKKARRYLHADERLPPNAMLPDYMLFVEFALASGLRLSECVLRKSQVGMTHLRLGIKGGEQVQHPITDEMRRILMTAMSKSPANCDWVFTADSKGGRKGTRKVLTKRAVESAWRRAREKGFVPLDMTLHGLRHTFAIDLLKKTRNIYLVKNALHHRQLATTEIYAKLLDDDLLEGMNMVERRLA